MPLKKGNTNIGAIYKGTTQIAKIYKGTKLLFENAKWLDYYFNNLYNSLIPTTIDNKAVQDKAKLTKIEGNGMVENQWLSDDYYPNTTTNGITISYDKSTHTLTLNGTASTTFNYDLNPSKEIFSGRKYLITAEMAEIINSRFALRYASVGPYLGYRSDGIYNDTNSKIGKICALGNGGDNISTFKITIYSGAVFNSLQVKNIQYIDLTLMFGTGNEPTTLTDNRIQALLNRGYIAYNTGSYKNSRVGEIKTFDSSNQLLDTITLPGLLELNGAINSHNTFEITNTDYVFTRNVGVVNNFSNVAKSDYYSNLTGISCYEFGPKPYSGWWDTAFYKCLCNKCVIKNYSSESEKNYIAQNASTAGFLYIPSSELTLEEATTVIQTLEIIYPLATPQVITIPKKHLGCVDLGSLTWYYDNESGHENMFTPVIDNIAKPTTENIGNIYCEKYMASSWTNLYIHNGKNIIAIQTNGRIRVYAENMGTSAADFKSAMAGQYLFYETENEVSDFDNIAQINAGGSITSNSEVLPNINFEIKCK